MSFVPRQYQQDALDLTVEYLYKNPGKNPCLVLPTAAGKSIICSMILKALSEIKKSHGQKFRSMVLAHRKEIIVQNYNKLKSASGYGSNISICSAGAGSKIISDTTFGGIQTVHKMIPRLGNQNILIVDECHLINHKKQGMYHEVINACLDRNPKLRVIGLTATPWRLGFGTITDGDTLFDDLIEPVTITDLLADGYLAKLTSKVGESAIDMTGVKRSGGEYVLKDMAQAIDTSYHNARVATEIIEKSKGRKKWLVFCAGVEHSHHMAEILNQMGIPTGVVTGKTPSKQRDKILKDLHTGKLTAICNSDVLTIGFDEPDIDLIVMLRATQSPALYVQIVGRGMRPKSHGGDCLILDFVGNIQTHGPITNVRPPRPPGKGGPGEAPVKLCPECSEVLHLSVSICPECKFKFPKPDKYQRLRIHYDDVLGIEFKDFEVVKWQWMIHESSAGNRGLRCVYYGKGSQPIEEYFMVMNEGIPGKIARNKIKSLMLRSGLDDKGYKLGELCIALNAARKPDFIGYVTEGRYRVVKKHIYLED